MGSFDAMLVSADRSAGVEESLSVSIVSAIANAEGVDPTAIRPPEYEALYHVCNPDALEALFSYDDDATPGSVQFEFCGYDVTVTSDGSVSVSDPVPE